ncbi:hypothetical protein N7516_001462 [Penicillium verrucosum]|uniref:uncharacterized protein n=1 Tax=Penicillium verrucosum TaxID=60171 RepID=UPI002545A69E|nr:uncharacterized protein N7516_001462 [Penicillium verrucosum]KAJ5941294.1 hypothetical protein N7516_001462 [Penicillium verrucosum]
MELGYKRRKLNEFEYPPIPVVEQDIVEYETANDPFLIRLIPVYLDNDHLQADKFRAESVTEVDDENEQLVRTYHPSLSSKKKVWASSSAFGETVWLVEKPLSPSDSVTFPGAFSPPRSPDKFNAHFTRYINPRRFLTPADLNRLRELFPEAVGVEVLIAGFLIVLFESEQHTQDAYREVWPLELAGLRVFFHTTRYSLTTTPIQSGLSVSADPNGEHHSRAGCLGLKLQLRNGSMAITTVTHGFVQCPGVSMPANIFNVFQTIVDKAKRRLRRYLPAKVGEDDGAFVMPNEVLTNDPVGKQVWLASSRKQIGAIAHTYDHPSRIKPYPHGYKHDLSLISDSALPDVTSPPGYPPVTGWADYTAALDGQDVYVVCYQTNVGRWRVITGTLDSELFNRAAVLGTGYTWDRKTRSQNSFLLWHTGANLAPADGWSGAPLCLGRPSDAAARAVVFQNFQEDCLLAGDSSTEQHHALVKAGFLLPPDIKDSSIVGVDMPNQNRPYNTLPGMNRESFTLESQRRSFSGI